MTEQICDLVGIGFGPAGIALAAAIEDWVEANGGERPGEIRFFEKNSSSVWQSGLLLPGTDIRHHYFRDFATPRNPRSRFTFANYLSEKGRLFDFGLLGGNVGRLEWADYVKWVAGQLKDYVTYNCEVAAVEPELSGGEVDLLRVRTSQGTVLTRNLVVATGQRPFVPEMFVPHLGDRCFHSSAFLPRVAGLPRSEPIDVALVGGGQCAAEAILYLHDKLEHSTMHSVQRTVGFKLADLGHFTNQIYFPKETDYFFNLGKEERERAFLDTRSTNYSVIDWDVSRALYWRVYEDRVMGRERIRIINRTRVVDVAQVGGRYRLSLEDVFTGRASQLESDAIVLCTGFREERFPNLLESLRPYLVSDGDGGLEIGRDYTARTKGPFAPRIYLSGMTERTHGMSNATSFSMMALKGEEIFRSIFFNGERPPLAWTGAEVQAGITS
ncbi:MAG TPA: SidA/IucD/PvdA family monooxygenase [Thermoanaerobaculia bacterium]|nr:SidA/IucD/PvdA family monooxygenase [Thermoanaerobaculia bacterium]